MKGYSFSGLLLAVGDGGAIAMSHLIKVATREHQKLGRTWQSGMPYYS